MESLINVNSYDSDNGDLGKLAIISLFLFGSKIINIFTPKIWESLGWYAFLVPGLTFNCTFSLLATVPLITSHQIFSES